MAIFNDRDSNTNGNNGGYRKADAFLNIALDRGEGKGPKIAGVPLYSDRVVDRQLIDALKDHPERAQALASRLLITFNMADGSTSTPLDLAFLQEDAG